MLDRNIIVKIYGVEKDDFFIFVDIILLNIWIVYSIF